MAPEYIYANGRFLTRQMSGVDRVAAEVLRALVQLDQAPMVRLLYPAGADVMDDPFASLPTQYRQKIEMIPFGSGKGHLWEQFVLPRFPEADPSKDWLLSLCNTGPLGWQQQLIAIHDAQVHDIPAGFSVRFRALYRFLQPRLARKAPRLVTVSHHAKARLEHHGVFPPDKAHVIRLGVDHLLRVESDERVLNRHDLVPGGFNLAIGSAAPHKNLQLLGQLAAQLGDNARPIVVAGGFNPRVFADLPEGVTNRLKMIGRVTEEELKALYQQAHCFLFPSLNEGFGLPPLEAMSLGCPVIATTATAVPEVLGEAAIYADPTDVGAWGQGLQQLDDPAFRALQARKGIAHSLPFTWCRAADEMLEILRNG